MISLNRVSYAYSGRPALNSVNLSLEPGERLALMGANGSGKSTLALLIKGLLEPDEGEILLDGMPPAASPPGKVGLVFQQPEDQLVASTAEREIAFGLENIGLSRDEMRRRVDEALTLFGLEELRKRPPHLLSGGQMQKLALASVMAMKPDYLILDEPTALLDPLSGRNFHRSLRKLQSSVGIILITQSSSESLDCHRLGVLREGEVCYDGSPESFFTRRESTSAAGIDPPLEFLLKARRGG